MEKEDIIKIANDSENKSNKDLIQTRDILLEEYSNTKNLIIDLTKHLEGVETLYNKINNEIGKRIK